jgi:hypothetical protein
MKMLTGRQYSFNQLSQFTMLNMGIALLASNIKGSLTRAPVLPPFTCRGDLTQRSPMKTLRDKQYSFEK